MTMSENRSLDQVCTALPAIVQVGVDGATHLYAGSFAAPLTATGMLAVGGGVASTNAVMGVCTAEADNTSGGDGVISVNLAQGVFRRKNSSGSPCVAATTGTVVYAEDGETVRIASGATYPVAGIFMGFEADGTTPLVFCSAVLNYLLSQGTLSSNLAAITTALGASLIGLEDATGYTTTANVEAAIEELYAKVQKRTLTSDHTTITTAGASEAVNLGAALPANSRIVGVTMHTYTPFTGGTISDFTVDIGSAGDADALIDGADLYTAAVDGGPATMTKGISPDKFYASSTQLVATFACGSDDVADASAGAVTIDVLYVVLA